MLVFEAIQELDGHSHPMHTVELDDLWWLDTMDERDTSKILRMQDIGSKDCGA
jgi:hypothetical protein